MAAVTESPSNAVVVGEEKNNLSKDKIELFSRPNDLGTTTTTAAAMVEEEEGKLCDDMHDQLQLRPDTLNSDDTSSQQSPSTNNDLYIHEPDEEEDEESEDEEEFSPKTEALRNLSENQASPLSIQNLSDFMNAGAEFLHEHLMSSRKRMEDIPEFMSSDHPPSKRAKHSGERRRGRPRKEEISENEDLKTVAKRMYARAYRENMKSKFIEVEQQLNDLRKEHAILKASHKKLESLVEQCNFCSSSWALVKNMNIDPVVLKMTYDALSNMKSESGSPSSSKTPSEHDRSEHSIEC